MSKHNAKIGKRKQQIKQGVGISLRSRYLIELLYFSYEQ